MQVSEFEHSPIGSLVAISGHDTYLDRDYKHFAFLPTPLPAAIPLLEKTYNMVAQASLALGRLDFAVRRLPNPSLLVRPALRREAQSTSALEGTYATLEEVLEADYLGAASRSAEVREIMNYVMAAETALEMIKTLPICVNLIRPLQKILVRGTRGDTYDAGELRKGQVFIGERKAGIELSRYVPPPSTFLVDGMSDWEKWLNAEDDIPFVAKAAIGHYQFESLHPFSDGNGRLGRLVVTLQLITHNVIAYPVLNLSPWLETRKEEYKDHLLAVSQTGDFNPWVQFFSQAVIASAQDGVSRIEDLHAFREDAMDRLHKAKVRGVAVKIADSLLGYPIITVPQAAKLHGVTYPAVNGAVARLVDLRLLREMTGREYGRTFACDQVLGILRRSPNDLS